MFEAQFAESKFRTMVRMTTFLRFKDTRVYGELSEANLFDVRGYRIFLDASIAGHSKIAMTSSNISELVDSLTCTGGHIEKNFRHA